MFFYIIHGDVACYVSTVRLSLFFTIFAIVEYKCQNKLV